MSIKYHFETSQGRYNRDRAQAEIKAQLAYELRLRAEARATLTRLRLQGRRVRISYSGDSWVGNRGIGVLPVPRLTEFGQLAWTVR